MRELPRLPDGASADEKIRIIYDWLYELQMEIKAERETPVAEKFAKRQISAGLGEKFPTEEIFTLMPLSQAEPASSPLGEPLKGGAVVPLFPKGDFPEKGYIVEDKGGIRWEVAEVSYVCERITPEEESAFRIPGIRMNFSASEIGTEVKVIGK